MCRKLRQSGQAYEGGPTGDNRCPLLISAEAEHPSVEDEETGDSAADVIDSLAALSSDGKKLNSGGANSGGLGNFRTDVMRVI